MINYLPPELPDFLSDLERLYPEIDLDQIGREITLQVTEDCCMACTYCYQNNKTKNKMTFEVAKDIIDKLLNDESELINTKNTFFIIYDFIGGEPFLEIDLIDQICQYILDSMIIKNHPWLFRTRFSFCSNGLLYTTEKVQRFLQKYEGLYSLTISVDGNKELHDKCRIDLSGNGTYDRVIQATHLHQKNYNFLPPTKMTLSPDNIMHTKEALINLINEGHYAIPFNCIFEPGWTNKHASILYYQLKDIADFLLDNDLYNKINIRMFNENDFQPISEEENRNWCGGVDMKMLAFNYQGDMYPCIRYMESSLNGHQKPIKVGNIHTGYMSTQEEINNVNLISNITRRSCSTDECFFCPIGAGCSWCSGYNYEINGTPNKRETNICIMHKAQALANVYYWNKLYKKLNIPKKFICYLPMDEALKIINENEYNYLLSLIK